MRHWLHVLQTWFVHEWRRVFRCHQGEMPPEDCEQK